MTNCWQGGRPPADRAIFIITATGFVPISRGWRRAAGEITASIPAMWAFGDRLKRDAQFADQIEAWALRYGQAGADRPPNLGHWIRRLLTRIMDENATLPSRARRNEVMRQAAGGLGALFPRREWRNWGLAATRIVISCK